MLTIGAIKEQLKNTDINNLESFIETFNVDERSGVQQLVQSARKKLKAFHDECARTEMMKKYENEFPQMAYIAGIDEVGRGPLAGPVVTAAVILPKDCNILYINDSKKLSEKKREALYDIIMKEAVAVSLGIEDVATIDDINILQATLKAMKKSIDSLDVKPDLILADAVEIPDVDIPQLSIIKGDAKSISIAAASIIAKVTRDRMMVQYDELFPEYGFAGNKGYGAQVHIEAIKEHGPCPIHRRTFIKNFV